ncbi:unnamed protein product [Heligmosomoides polygyrus]|uniref:RanBP2-type domain-containing protein n=1 Tax=Heligmosomoides polygyrus TaxID=6339 RepID=A0A3P8ATN8_HELPZ|nr:unnamed protein product [Heligmosomoides polygyrus]
MLIYQVDNLTNIGKTRGSRMHKTLQVVVTDSALRESGSLLTPAFEASAQSSRNLRYLSPSLLESGVSKPSVSRPVPAEDIFVMSTTTSRKRALTQDQRPATAMDGLLSTRDNPKRSRRDQFATSMLEDVEARKLPVMRGSTVPSERWAPMSSGAPPLVKSSATVPSRIQLLSSSLASQRKPYWRDITRKYQEKEKDETIKEGNEKSDNNAVHPLFDMDNNGSNCDGFGMSSTTRKRSAGPYTQDNNGSMRESDGKSKSANVFNASQLVDDDDMTGTSEDKAADIPVFAPPVKAAPPPSLLDDMVFSFEPPVKRLPGQGVCDRTLTEDNNRSDSEESESSSSSDESDNEQSSSSSDQEESKEQRKEQKTSRPPTAADSETSGAVSSSITPNSSKDVSPQTKNETSWSCPDCFITNKNVSICAACGHNKDAAAGAKTLVSNISSFGKSDNTSFRFGFAAEASKDANSNKDNDSSAPPKKSSWSDTASSFAKPAASSATVSFGINGTKPETSTTKVSTDVSSTTSTTSAPAKASESAAEKKRVAWECPDCMVQNKDSDDKCVCCGHVMYKSAGVSSATTSSVFGDRAFKVSAPPTTAAFESSLGKTEEAKPQAPAFSLGAGTAIFGSGAKPPLFGSSSSTSLFNTSFSSGSLLTSTSSAPTPATTAAPAVTGSQPAATTAPTPFVFGSASSTAKPFSIFDMKDEGPASKMPSFGNGSIFGASSTNSNQVSSSGGLLGTTTNAESAGKPLTGPSSGTGLFGSSTTAKPLFSSFGSAPDATKPPSFLGSATTASSDSFKPSPFGAALAASIEAQKPPLFGASATNSISKPLFGASAPAPPAAPTANGGLSFGFGSTSNTFGSFGGASSSTPSLSSVPSTSSTTSIFGAAPAAPAATEPPKPFQFGATIPEPTFQFGQSSGFGGTTPFQFGSAQTTAPPAAPTFQMPGITAPAAPSSNFSFTEAYEIQSVLRILPAKGTGWATLAHDRNGAGAILPKSIHRKGEDDGSVHVRIPKRATDRQTTTTKTPPADDDDDGDTQERCLTDIPVVWSAKENDTVEESEVYTVRRGPHRGRWNNQTSPALRSSIFHLWSRIVPLRVQSAVGLVIRAVLG